MPPSRELYAILLAGGSGTRLWPLSRRLFPKHLLSFDGGQTLLQQATSRLLNSIPPERIVTVTHKDQQSEVRGQLAPVHPALADRILVEPAQRNTLPAIAWAVAEIAKEDPKATVVVSPADHLVQNKILFEKELRLAQAVAEKGYLAAFGIRPTSPETGYGYIEAGQSLDGLAAHRISSFVEKPDLETAKSLLQKGNYYWNSGIFIFPVDLFQEELARLAPEISRAIALPALYASLKPVSIDYGIMEKTKRAAVIPATFQWSDLGSWETIYESGKNDSEQNVIRGDVLALDTKASLLISEKGFLAAIGLENMVVVQTGDAVLVSRRDRVQDVKKIVDALKEKGSGLVENHPTVVRPWGSYTVLEEGKGYKIKRIIVNPGQKLSLQSHQRRSEHWVVIEGTAKITKDQKESLLNVHESAFISQGEKHRLENPGAVPLVIIEVQTGTYLGEDDIQRFEDIYGRISH